MSMLVTFLASILIWFLIGLLILFFVLNSGLKRKQIMLVIFSGLVALGLSILTKELIPQAARPFVINSMPYRTLTFPGDSSYPSEHTALAFGLAFAVYLKNKKLGVGFVTGALLVAFGRVLANVHFIIDVVGSIVLGAFSALLLDILKIDN